MATLARMQYHQRQAFQADSDDEEDAIMNAPGPNNPDTRYADDGDGLDGLDAEEAEQERLLSEQFGEAGEAPSAASDKRKTTTDQDIAAELAGEAPSEANGCVRMSHVHPDVALRRIANGCARRRDWSGRFALAPIPRLAGVPRGRARTVLAVDLRVHAVTVDEIREQLRIDRAADRAARLAAPRAHLDPWNFAPVFVTADELRHGELEVREEREMHPPDRAREGTAKACPEVEVRCAGPPAEEQLANSD